MFRPPVKPLEHPWLFLLGDSRPGVADMDGGEQLVSRHRYTNHSTGWGIFHGVVQQIVERFLRPFGVKYSIGFRRFQGDLDFLRRRLWRDLRKGGIDHSLQTSASRMQGDNPGFQAGGFHQRVNQALQLLRLPIQSIQTGPVSRLLHEKLGVEQNVGNGRFGLVGDVPDEGFQLVLFRLDISGGHRGRREVVGQLAFQGGEHTLVKAVLGKIPLHGDIQHPVQMLQNPPGAPAIPENNATRKQ